VGQSFVLSEINTATSLGEPITAQQISERLGIEKSTLARLLARLADAHMITFTPKTGGNSPYP
jgi:DNA-binding IclR family transcriptional regulator